MNSKNKILIVTKGFEGGAGTYTLQLFKLKNYLKRVSIEALILQEPTYRSLDGKKYSISYLPTIPSPTVYGINLSTIFLVIQELAWLKRQIQQKSPSVIISVDTHSNILVMLLRSFLFRNVSIICTNHVAVTQTADRKSSFFLKSFTKLLIGKYFYKSADAVVGVSQGVSDDLQSYFRLKKRPTTIYNGVQVKPIFRENKHVSKTKNIISIARLVEQKDVETLISAFSLLVKKYPQTRLQLIGDGPLRELLKKKVRHLQIENAVDFLGWQGDPAPFLDKAYIFVLSTKREGFSYSILEAMARGIPVIVTDAPFGPRELLGNNEYGMLVPLEDPKKLYNAMDELLGNKARYNDLKKKSYVRATHFSERAMLREYSQLILSINKNIDKSR